MISAYIRYADGRVSIHSEKAESVGTIFEKGFYEVSTDNNGNMSIFVEKLEELHAPYNTPTNKIIIKTVDSFFSPGMMEKVNELGFVHKIGCLLFGCQGGGKSALLNFIANKLVQEREGIVFFCNNSNTLKTAINLARMIREIQPNPIVFIADEFEKYAKDAESEMKNFLDGNTSINNTLFLAATNYIEMIPDTLKNRPSRFKVVMEIEKMKSKKLMKTILRDISNKISPSLFTKEQIDVEVEKLKEATLDELKHLCLDKLTDNYLPKIKTRPTQIGFNKNIEEEEEEECELILPATPGVWQTFTLNSNKPISNSDSNL